jgi:hypothetical protein
MLPDSDHNASLPPDETTDAFLNYQWRRIIVGILERELPKFAPDDTDYQDRINTLIQDIYDLSEPLPTLQVEITAIARIGSTQSFGVGNTIVTWNTGSAYDAGNPTRITPGEGNITLQAMLHFTSATASVGHVEIIKNGGSIIGRQSLGALAANFENLVVFDLADADDYYEVQVNVNVASTLQISTLLPQVKIERLYVE